MQERTITIIARMSGDLAENKLKDKRKNEQRDAMHKNDPRRGKLNRYKNRVSTAKENGKKGGRPKKKQGLKTKSVNSANPNISESKANQEPITNNQEPITKLSFDDFYNGYAYKNSRGQAERAWNKLSDEDRAKAIAAAPKDASHHHEKNRSAGQDKNAFRQHPGTWLNSKGWDNEIISPEEKIVLDPQDPDSWRKFLGKPAYEFMRDRHRNNWPGGAWGKNPWNQYNPNIPAEIRKEYGEAWNWKGK